VFIGCVYYVWKTGEMQRGTFCKRRVSCNTISNKLTSDIHLFVIVRILGQLRTVECNACNIRCLDQ